MKKRDFVLPNLVATVRFVDGEKDAKLLLHGPDQAALEARLKRHYPGIQIKQVAAYDFAAGWAKVADDSKQAVDAARAKNEKYEFDKNSVWGELKEFLFDLFDQHCAYCECEFRGGNAGAVEHYRPKNPVLGVPGHPGYYWLAYEATNYLPTCTRCNSGKSNSFVLAPGSPRAVAPGDEKLEHPLLLNPWLLTGEVTGHIAFTAASTAKQAGPVAKGLTPEGKETVKRLKLNRPDVLVERYQEQQRAVGDYFYQRATQLNPPPVVEQLKAGWRPFSAASMAAIAGVEQGFPSLGG